MKNELQIYIESILDALMQESKRYPKMWTKDTIRLLNEILKKSQQ